jgi:DNA-binding NarL/FixJ family response regulator
MHLILCCSDTSLRKRWRDALEPAGTLLEASKLTDLRSIAHRVSAELMLIHRPMVDLGDLAYIRQKLPACRLFVLNDRPEEEDGLALIRLGVVGYANSYINQEGLRQAVRVIATGSVWINQQLMQRLILETRPAGSTAHTEPRKRLGPEALPALSPREYQIACLVADGLANLEIAADLDISERTVKAHLSAIYAKTASRGRLNLALLLNQGY